MSSTPDLRLRKLLGGEPLAALRLRLRRHFERMDPGAALGILRFAQLSPLEHDALALLTGRSPRSARSMQIDLAELDAALRDAGIADSLRDALEQIDGPIVHRAAARDATRARWASVIADCRHAGLTDYLQRPAALGMLKRLARQDTAVATRLLERAETVLRRTPLRGMPRAQLAAETLGNAHALDGGQATASLVLAALRHGEAVAAATEDVDDESDRLHEERSRSVWARAGVLVNELARPALSLNLPVQGHKEREDVTLFPAGEPGCLTLRWLLRAPPVWAVRDRNVFVCENPNVVAIAADHLGAQCAPLVCTDGMPAAAQRTLLQQLIAAGAHLRYHGDFDWPGLRIANYAMRAFGAQPWRMGRGDYETAAINAPHAARDLAGEPVTAIWDGTLAASMRHHGLSIAEEAVVAGLLEDLQRG